MHVTVSMSGLSAASLEEVTREKGWRAIFQLTVTMAAR